MEILVVKFNFGKKTLTGFLLGRTSNKSVLVYSKNCLYLVSCTETAQLFTGVFIPELDEINLDDIKD